MALLYIVTYLSITWTWFALLYRHTLFLQGIPYYILDALQVFLRFGRLEAIGDGRLGVGGTHQCPACGENDAHAVGGNHFVLFGELHAEPVDQGELLRLI